MKAIKDKTGQFDFYDLSNIVYAMAKEVATSLNLILESLEFATLGSLDLVENVIDSLNQNMLSIDELGHKMLSTQKDLNLPMFWLFLDAADSYEYVGKKCVSATSHLYSIIKDFSSVDSIAPNLSVFTKFVQVLLERKNSDLFQTKTLCVRSKTNSEDQEKLTLMKDELMYAIVKIMNHTPEFSFLYSELMFFIKTYKLESF